MNKLFTLSFLRHAYRLQLLPRIVKCESVNKFSTKHVKNMELYETLGVDASATLLEIKKAYYDLTLRYHPDRNYGCQDAALKFREVTAAYEILSNYTLRKRYDHGLPLPLDITKFPAVEKTVTTQDVKYQKFYDSRLYKPSTIARPAFGHYEEARNKRTEEHFKFAETKLEDGLVVKIYVVIMLAIIWYGADR